MCCNDLIIFFFKGKSTAAFAALRYLAAKYQKTILYLPLKSAGLDQNQVIAMLVKDWVIKVTLPIGDNYGSCLDKVIRRIRPQGVFLDGFCVGLEKLVASIKANCQDPSNFISSFIGATTSMTSSVITSFQRYKTLTSSPWLLQDYINSVHAGMIFNELRLKNLGLESGATPNSIIAALKIKFIVAGYSCRFMLDYDEEAVVEKLKHAINRTSTYSMEPEKSQQIVNTLFVSIDKSLVPVSLAAGYLIALSKKFDSPTNVLGAGIADVYNNNHRAMLGWLFEQEVVSRLKNHLRNAATKTFVVSTRFAGIIASVGDMSLAGPEGSNDSEQVLDVLKRLTVEPVFSPDAPIPFQLLEAGTTSATTGKAFEIPMQGIIKQFSSWEVLVKLVVEHNWDDGPIWLLPECYGNPFFDFALAERQAQGVGGAKGSVNVNMKTFQVTIAATHSCNAHIVQCIHSELQKHPVNLTSVVHHAVLPSEVVAHNFQFVNQQCMSGLNVNTRASSKPNQEERSKRRRNSKSYEGYREDDEDFLDDHASQFAAAESRHTPITIQIGVNLVLKDSMCSETLLSL
jgi:hypothetical protein